MSFAEKPDRSSSSLEFKQTCSKTGHCLSVEHLNIPSCWKKDPWFVYFFLEKHFFLSLLEQLISGFVDFLIETVEFPHFFF